MSLIAAGETHIYCLISRFSSSKIDTFQSPVPPGPEGVAPPLPPTPRELHLSALEPVLVKERRISVSMGQQMSECWWDPSPSGESGLVLMVVLGLKPPVMTTPEGRGGGALLEMGSSFIRLLPSSVSEHINGDVTQRESFLRLQLVCESRRSS